ncbi:MAG: glycosyltransferase family 39 protein [Bryobacter sp.]|nr:glycosyltransferase family 39 protein [Bryobacter sp.]
MAISVALLCLLVGNTRSHWLGEDFGQHPDEAGHFVTTMMVYDYLTSAFGQAPMPFAESYYARYPKVALGHWPPLYYALESAWFLVVSPGVAQAHAFNLLLAAILAWVCWSQWRQEFSSLLAICGIVGLLSLPVLQVATQSVLSDLLVVLLCTLALHSAARGSLWTGLLAAAAILSKGNAFALLPAMLLAALLLRDWPALRSRRLWLPIGIAVAVGAPFYLYARAAGLSYPLEQVAKVSTPVYWRRLQSSVYLLSAVPWPMWPLAALGFYWGLRGQADKLRRMAALHGAFLLCLLGFLVVTGLSFEDRAMLPAFPSIVFLCMLALRGLPMRWAGEGAAVAAVLLLLYQSPPLRPLRGIREAVAALPLGEFPQAVLAVGPPNMEGAVVAFIRLRDPERRHAVLRSARHLSQQTWNGGRYQERLPDDAALQQWLREVPVSYVVLDAHAQQPHALRLRELASAWDLLERRWSPGGVISAYRVPENEGLPLRSLEVPLGPERGNRVLRLPGED